MTLTATEVAAVKHGEPVTISPPEVGTECVLLRKDVFERVRKLIYDDSEYEPREGMALINDVMAEDDANDPWLDSYQTP